VTSNIFIRLKNYTAAISYFSFKFGSGFLNCLFSALATPRSAISAVGELLFPLV